MRIGVEDVMRQVMYPFVTVRPQGDEIACGTARVRSDVSLSLLHRGRHPTTECSLRGVTVFVMAFDGEAPDRGQGRSGGLCGRPA